MFRRFFAFLLAFHMLFSSVPTQALAAMIDEEPAITETTNHSADETTAFVETTTTQDVPTPLSETTVPETTAEESVPETTVEETVPETTVEETVPETTVEETVPETTVETVNDHVHGDDCYDADGKLICAIEEHVHEEKCYNAEGELICGVQLPVDDKIANAVALAVTEPELTGNWAADTLAIAQSYEGYTQETDTDGNPYTVFGAHFNDAANTSWNTHFIAYCLARAGVDTDIFPVNVESAEEWKNSLEPIGYYYAKDSGYTPVAGDLIFWSPWYPTSYQVGILTSTNTNLTADYGNQEGKVGTQNTWDAQVMGYARIPNSDGTLEQTLTAKVYTDDTFTTEDTSASAVVEGNLPVNAEIRVFPVTLTAEQDAALREIGEVVAAYGVKVFVNGEEYTGTINDPVSVKITADVFGSGAAMMPYALADMQKLSASLSGSTLNLNVKIPNSFALVGISSAEVTTAAELKAAVEMGVPEITLGADITVDAANDNMTVSKAVKIELNGKNLIAAGDNALFNISSSGNLTMEDKGTETVTKSSGTNISRPDSVDDAALGSVAKGTDGKAVLTYYTTKSTVTNLNGATQETRYQHTVSAAGMIENKTTQPLFNVNGGTLNINGGTYVGNLDGGYTGRGIVQNGGTTNLNGGYLAGFNVNGRTDWSDLNDFGGAIRTTGGNLNIANAVIAGNQAASGAGIYAANTTVTLNDGVISGNKATGVSDAAINDNGGPHFGGAGVYLGEGSKITVNGSNSYITNNSAPEAKGYADGGAAIFARKWTNITINNGYITSNTVGGGGGAIRTIYGTETNYGNMESDAVKNAVEMSIYINGGYICGNFCRYAEGGGVSINAGTGCWFTGGYINNNATATQRDWGGGGLFNANGSYLEIKNVLITENNARGLGGGVGGCSTGDIHLAVTEGGAMFDNTAQGANWSGEGSQKREDVEFAGENPNFDMENADDYFCVHNSMVEAQMLGRGSCDWVGTCDDEKVAPPQRTVLEASTVMGLTSYAMDPAKKEARGAAKAFINGNYSNVHGGGIMCNGVLDVGTPLDGPMPAWLEVVGTKIYESNNPLGTGMFEFELLLYENDELIATGINDSKGHISFGKQLVFQEVGEFTYTICEKNGGDDKIIYDDTIYTLVVTTKEDSDGNISIASATVNGVAVEGIEEGSFYVTLPEGAITFVNSSEDMVFLTVQAHKIWEDDSDRDGKRPKSITVELYANGVSTGKTLELSNISSATGSNSWSGQFSNLDRNDANGNPIEYSVKEVSVPEGYKVSYSENEHDGSLVITNTHIPETTEVTATKIWQDSSDQDGKRPESIVLTLYADGTPYKDAEGNGRTVTLSGDSDTWTATISDLPMYKNIAGVSSKIVYTFEETTVPEGYTKVAEGTTITNKYTPEETQISFQKTWVDSDDQDGKRPNSITVNLLANGNEVDSLTVTAETNYGGSFNKLPKYEDGVEIIYTLEEEPVDGYTTNITGTAADGFLITNTHEIEKTDLSVKKVWNDFGNQDNKRTPGIVVALYGNDKVTPINEAILNEANQWSHTWENLDLYEGGNYIDYSVVEVAYINANGTRVEGTPDGYTVTHAYNNEADSIIWTEATITNTLTPELTTLNVQKQWDDNNDQDGIRPESIILTLWKTTTKPTETVYVNGHAHYKVDPSEDSGWVKAVDGEGQNYVLTMKPTENGAWDADFENLPKYEAGKLIYYGVTEEAVAGYTPSYELDPDTNVLYIKNTHETEKTEIAVYKNWDDSNNQDGKRPASITVSLYGRDKVTPLETVTLPDANGNWNYKWTGLDKNYKGTAIIYTVVETAVPGYNVNAQGEAQNVTGAPDASGNIVLTNTYVPRTTSISVIKEWDDEKNQDGKRPASITVELVADGEKTGKTLTLSADTNWQGTFTDLPVNQEKTNSTDLTKEIKYEIWEDAVAEYNDGQPQTVKVENGVVRLKNTHKTEVVSITATKIWNDEDNQDGNRPESIVLHLLADGEHTNQKAELKPDYSGNWSYTWVNLPKYSDGNEIDYSILEEHVGNGYSSNVDGFIVTNTYAPEKTFVSVLKNWTDGNNQDGVRPASITVELLANGQPTGDRLDLNESNHWYGSFTDLDKYDGGVEINYSVQEQGVVEGYKPGVVTGSLKDGYTITNERTVEKTEIKVTKAWEDDNNRDGMRPAFVTVVLYRDGVATDKTAELSAANNWTYTWTDLDANHRHGVKYAYSVEEIVPDGYAAITTGNAAEGYVITNKHDIITTSVPVVKIWDDAENQDGKRPTEIQVQLKADGAAVGEPVTLNAANNWSYNWDNLPKYKNVSGAGVEIKYTVSETEVPGYKATVNGTTITNTHEVEMTDLNVRKVWSDFNDKAKMRPYAVVITLHENGKLTDKTLTLSNENGWKGVWEDMPRYRGGSWIAYTVVETGFYQTKEDYQDGKLTTGVPSGYMVSHSYDRTDTSNPVATVTNTYAPDSVGLNVQKRWDDDNNREDIRPKELKVTLWYKIGENGNWDVMEDNTGDPMTVVLSESNQWDADFIGLPKHSNGELIYYKVVEEDIDGYEADYKINSSTGVVTITNTHSVNKDVKIAVSKVWDDNDNQDNIRPEEIVVTLYANGIKTSSTQTLKEDNGWKAEWTGLYEYYKGEKIVYTVVEENVPEGYEVTVTGDASTGFVITNSHETETVNIPVEKIWDDNDNQDGIRPDYITVTLLANGEKTSKVLTLNVENHWKGTFSGLDKYDNGVEIKYSIEEAIVRGYNVNEKGESQKLTLPVVNGKVIITNVHAPEKTTLTAVKKWLDNDDQDGKRPASVTVHLLANGVHMGEEYTCVLNEANGWAYTWENLEKYVSGQLIRYTVYEEPVEFKNPDIEAEAEIAPASIEHYVADYVRDSETQITINNRYIPETTFVEVIKVWDDDANRDGLRAKSIDVQLMANGKKIGKVVTLDESNGWTTVWTNLPKYENHGVLIEYEVEEVNVPDGYDSSVIEDEEDPGTFTMTNTHVPATTGIKVTKTWRDDNNNDGMRPDGLIVQLYADGTAVDGARVILSDVNGWKHTFQSTEEDPLYIYNNGELINYYVQEIGYVSNGVEHSGMPEGYVGSTSQDKNSYAIEITNTRASAKTKLTVNKVWEDGNNADGIRPTSIQVALLKNGTEVETVTLNKQNNWTYTWNNLYKYAGGVEVKYTVRETPVGNYTVGYTYTTSADGKTTIATVTNSYTPVGKWITVQKVWKDNDNEEGVRPTAVTVQLYKNGDAYGEPIVLTAANNWQAAVLLPVNENGVEIKWTVKEINIPRYYTASYDQKTLTITNSIQSKEVPRTGDNNNLMLWVGLLGVCGAGAVTVLAVDKKKKRSK